MSGRLDGAFWQDRTVLVTGHMGFKGAWLVYLLARLGAETIGYGFDRRPRLLYRGLAIPGHTSVEADVNDLPTLRQAIRTGHPSIILHLAAQPIVLTSYQDPLGTFRDNIMGTASLLEAARAAQDLEAIVVVTSDKVYRNDEVHRAYREGDSLGGRDPYSASKAAAEIVTAAMIASFYSDSDSPGVATARAGNVVGGGDWADFRLLPDAARAFAEGRKLEIRNPDSVRPWQHVLEPLMGYLQLAQALARQRQAIPARAWNFGPRPEDAVSVRDVADLFVGAWGEGGAWTGSPREGARHEAGLLAVDSTLSATHLGWTPRWHVAEAVGRTARWYRDHQHGVPAAALIDRDIDAYLSPAEGARHEQAHVH
ncbi:MAG: CDP-glucose 4,6-dehydratase [Devosia sp.]|nr:CDP-glucose 4,6-dehydratase [Devosia sp.]